MKLWEAVREAKVRVVLETPLLVARSLFRKSGERVIPVVKEVYSDKLVGFVNRVDALLVTSRKSNVLIRDAVREHPIAVSSWDFTEAFKVLEEFNLYAMPVVEDYESMRLAGVITCADMIKALIRAGYSPIAESVNEVMTVSNIDEYIITPGERVNRVWSKFVYRGYPALVVVREASRRIPVGIVTPKDFIDHGRWLFHRESEQHITSPAKVSRVMTRGVVIATVDMPVEAVAKVMVENDFTVVPVIDENGEVIGIITQRDVVRAYLEGRKPGRMPVPLMPMPKPVTVAERIKPITMTRLVSQVLVRKAIAPAVGLRAADVMRREMPAISVFDTVEHARKEMLRRRTNYLLVVDEEGRIVGVVSKRNMLLAIGTRGPIWRRRLRDRFFIDYIMTKHVPRVPEDTPIENVALEMIRSGSDVVIVVDRAGEIVGFVAKDDLVEVFQETQYGRVLVENVMTPAKLGVVHPFHSLHYAVSKMRAFYLDALAVYDGLRVRGVVSENRLPFMAFEDAVTGIKSRRLIWVRKLVRGAARLGRYVKITPLVVADVTVPLKEVVGLRDDVVTALSIMSKNNVNGLPVVDEHGVIMGVICKNDVVRELARSAKPVVKLIEAEWERMK